MLKILQDCVKSYIGHLMYKILPISPHDHRQQVCPIMIFDTEIVENTGPYEGQCKLAIHYLAAGEKHVIHVTTNSEFHNWFQPYEGFDLDVTIVNKG